MKNMTKVSVFGENGNINQAELKSIELVNYVNSDGELSGACKAGNWDNLQLLDSDELDTIIAWNDGSNRHYIYLGH